MRMPWNGHDLARAMIDFSSHGMWLAFKTHQAAVTHRDTAQYAVYVIFLYVSIHTPSIMGVGITEGGCALLGGSGCKLLGAPWTQPSVSNRIHRTRIILP